MPELILAQVSLQSAISSPTNVEVGGSLFGEIPICKNEQTKRSKEASGGRTTAGAAVIVDISLDHRLKFSFVDLKLCLYVQLGQWKDQGTPYKSKNYSAQKKNSKLLSQSLNSENSFFSTNSSKPNC